MASLDKQQTKSRKMDVQNSVTSDDLARYVRLLFFGLMNVARESDTLLLRKRLWRNHHRVLDSLSRGVARSLSELAVRNGTSKQTLHKSIQGLLRANLVQVEVDPLHRRAKSVKLTPAGRKFEATLDDCQQRVFAEVAAEVGKEKMEIWAEVMAKVMEVPPPPKASKTAPASVGRGAKFDAPMAEEESPGLPG